MTDRCKVFTTDPFSLDEDGEVIINPDILVVDAIRNLVNKRKGIRGDFNGKLGLYARKELTYIYHMEHYRSPYAGQPPRVRKGAAIRIAGLDKVKAVFINGEVAENYMLWKEDEVCETARLAYAALIYQDPIPLLVKNTKAGIYTGNEILAQLNSRVTERLHDSKLKTDGLDAEREAGNLTVKQFTIKLEEVKKAENIDVEFILSAYASIREAVKDMPKMIANMELTEKQVSKIEEAGAKVIKISGNKILPSRANPNRQKRVQEAKSGEDKEVSLLTRE